jgi:polar amino acid transport system substrate-binding protein
MLAQESKQKSAIHAPHPQVCQWHREKLAQQWMMYFRTPERLLMDNLANRLFCFWFGFCMLALSPVTAAAYDIRTPTYESRPKHFRENGVVKGLCIDVLKAIEDIDPSLRFVGMNDTVPLKRIEHDTANGKFDLMLCASQTHSRDASLIRIDLPIYVVDDILVVRDSDPLKDATIDDIRSIKKNNVIMAYVATGQAEWLLAQKGLVVDANALTSEAVLEKLLLKRGRFVLINEAVATNLMKLPEFSGKFRKLPTAVRTRGRYFYFSTRTPPEVVNQVKVALERLAAEGKLKKIVRRYELE